tara:strand:+ start:452 stop:601 length:150 start_codon:yes stop_codon:yes gene_type:complete
MITEDAVEKLKETNLSVLEIDLIMKLDLDINTFKLKPDKDEQIHSNKRH